MLIRFRFKRLQSRFELGALNPNADGATGLARKSRESYREAAAINPLDAQAAYGIARAEVRLEELYRYLHPESKDTPHNPAAYFWSPTISEAYREGLEAAVKEKISPRSARMALSSMAAGEQQWLAAILRYKIVDSLEDPGEVNSDCKIEQLEKAARDCAQIFQRSSSCVEGRNAQLALRHQGIHRLSNRHLQALTVMHNYYIRRRDGTTAAERLFEAKPNDLFEFLLDRMDYPARPRNRLKLAA